MTSSPIVTRDTAADVFDTVIDHDTREAGALAFLLLNPDGSLLTSLLVEDIPPGLTRRQQAATLDRLFTQVAEFGVAIAFAHARAGSAMITDNDRTWHELVLLGARDHDLPVLGGWVVGGFGVRALPRPLGEDLAAAS